MIFASDTILSIVSIAADIATVGAVIVAIVQLEKTKNVQKAENERIRKQATLDAVNVLQEEVFDKMAFYTDNGIKKIAEDSKTKKYKIVAAMMGRCEHFAVGVYEGIYDINTAKELCGEHLYYLCKKLKPMIKKKRQGRWNKNNYVYFEKLAEEMIADKNTFSEGEKK